MLQVEDCVNFSVWKGEYLKLISFVADMGRKDTDLSSFIIQETPGDQSKNGIILL